MSHHVLGSEVERRYKQDRGHARQHYSTVWCRAGREVHWAKEQAELGTAYDIATYRLLAPGESQYDDEAT